MADPCGVFGSHREFVCITSWFQTTYRISYVCVILRRISQNHRNFANPQKSSDGIRIDFVKFSELTWTNVNMPYLVRNVSILFSYTHN